MAKHKRQREHKVTRHRPKYVKLTKEEKREQKLKGIFIVQEVRALMGHLTMDKEPESWMDTGSSMLNAVYGNRKRGLAYGKMYTTYGRRSAGKSGIILDLMAKAQQDDAACAIVDPESSWSKTWAKIRGLDPSKVYVIDQHLFKRKGGRELKLADAADMFDELEFWIRKVASKHYKKFFVAVDSIKGLMPPIVSDTKNEDYNMRTRMGLPQFLSDCVPKLIALTATYNIQFHWINQTRKAPNVMFGNPEYMPGGETVPYFSHAIVKARRAGGKKEHRVHSATNEFIGLRGILENEKNKLGRECEKVGYKIYFNKPRVKYRPVED